MDSSLFWTQKNKINKQVEKKQTHRYKEQFDSCPVKGDGGNVEKIEGIKKYKLVVIEQSWGCEIQHREYSQ